MFFFNPSTGSAPCHKRRSRHSSHRHRSRRSRQSHRIHHIRQSRHLPDMFDSEISSDCDLIASRITSDISQLCAKKTLGLELFWEFVLFKFGFFWISCSGHFPYYLQDFEPGSCCFHCVCSIFDFGPLLIHSFCIILMESATFWCWKLSFQRL